MNKFIIKLVTVAWIATFATSANATVLQWQEAKELSLKAQANGERVILGNWEVYDNFIKEVSSFDEKVTVTKLWTITADGSYGDLIIPGIGALIGLYQLEAKSGSKQYMLTKLLKSDLIEVVESVDSEGYYRSHKEDIKLLQALPLKEGQSLDEWIEHALSIKVVAEAYTFSKALATP